MQIFGDVGELGEVGKCAGHSDAVGVAEPAQDRLQFGAGLGIAFAPEADGGLADALNQVESVVALLLAQGVAEQTPEHADVLLEREILVESRIGAVVAVHRAAFLWLIKAKVLVSGLPPLSLGSG
jgi:hypothetical protein